MPSPDAIQLTASLARREGAAAISDSCASGLDVLLLKEQQELTVLGPKLATMPKAATKSKSGKGAKGGRKKGECDLGTYYGLFVFGTLINPA